MDMLKYSIIGLAGILACAAYAAHADDGDPRAGRAFATDNCQQCHEIGNGRKLLSPLAAGPAFRDVANASTTTPLSLHVFLMTSHPTMPNIILSKKEVDDVVSYILSLRRQAPNPT
jgi:mono/diheme cytochrome c family protein